MEKSRLDEEYIQNKIEELKTRGQVGSAPFVVKPCQAFSKMNVKREDLEQGNYITTGFQRKFVPFELNGEVYQVVVLDIDTKLAIPVINYIMSYIGLSRYDYTPNGIHYYILMKYSEFLKFKHYYPKRAFYLHIDWLKEKIDPEIITNILKEQAKRFTVKTKKYLRADDIRKKALRVEFLTHAMGETSIVHTKAGTALRKALKEGTLTIEQLKTKHPREIAAMLGFEVTSEHVYESELLEDFNINQLAQVTANQLFNLIQEWRKLSEQYNQKISSSKNRLSGQLSKRIYKEKSENEKENQQAISSSQSSAIDSSSQIIASDQAVFSENVDFNVVDHLLDNASSKRNKIFKKGYAGEFFFDFGFLDTTKWLANRLKSLVTDFDSFMFSASSLNDPQDIFVRRLDSAIYEDSFFEGIKRFLNKDISLNQAFLCPIHPETRPSVAIYKNGNYYRFVEFHTKAEIPVKSLPELRYAVDFGQEVKFRTGDGSYVASLRMLLTDSQQFLAGSVHRANMLYLVVARLLELASERDDVPSEKLESVIKLIKGFAVALSTSFGADIFSVRFASEITGLSKSYVAKLLKILKAADLVRVIAHKRLYNGSVAPVYEIAVTERLVLAKALRILALLGVVYNLPSSSWEVHPMANLEGVSKVYRINNDVSVATLNKADRIEVDGRYIPKKDKWRYAGPTLNVKSESELTNWIQQQSSQVEDAKRALLEKLKPFKGTI